MFTTIVVTAPVEIAIYLWLVGLRFISTVPTTEKKHDFRYLAKSNISTVPTTEEKHDFRYLAKSNISTVPTTEEKHDFRYLAKSNIINAKNVIFTS